MIDPEGSLHSQSISHHVYIHAFGDIGEDIDLPVSQDVQIA